MKFCARDGWFPATAGELCAFAEDSADQIDEWLPRNGENGVYEVIGAAGSRVETVPKNEEGVSGPSLAVAALWFEHWVGNCAGWKSVAEPGKRLPEFGHWLLVRPA